ncbi:MAG: Crp/Fnr family transcriptional regulator [Intestinibacter sp.]|uniref:Crp/Fnr family transcriptional regulator n=1 Tax=Intestinibacter sp. TaxID=1965304 RepID=UPI002A815650|nr:Crp/Fnr family transcriptional regulator [Intestinibacter sp.]MDY4575462.1 Crp/Fnr family transcriptional regulator [Intestinibacter sp.]
MFYDMKPEEISNFFKDIDYTIKTFSAKEIIALEGDECKYIGVILDGTLDIKRMLSNKVVKITSVGPGHLFGEVIVFSDVNKYPATVISSSKSEILFISKENFIKFCYTHADFLEMFLKDLSNKILILNKSIERLSYNSIRQKISNYILDEYQKQGSRFINISMTKQKLAETLGVPRPSLSRELINMKELSIIDYSKDTIKILDLEALFKILDE